MALAVQESRLNSEEQYTQTLVFQTAQERTSIGGPEGNPQITLQHALREQMSLCMVKHGSQQACFIFHVDDY